MAAEEEAVEVKKNGEGDQESKSEASLPPEPPKIPDVELLIDGFGFMPKNMREQRTSRTSRSKMNKVQDSDSELRFSCASSTNIDIVRRYTWKTKNRMTVQVQCFY